METLCTIIGTNEYVVPYLETSVPLKEAIEKADRCKASGKHKIVRVYAETNNGATLTLIYQPS